MREWLFGDAEKVVFWNLDTIVSSALLEIVSERRRRGTYIVKFIPIQVSLLIYNRGSETFIPHITTHILVVIFTQFFSAHLIELWCEVEESGGLGE